MASREKPNFEQLALPHLELLYRVARRLTRHEQEAEDLVQETYLKAYQSFARFELREYGIKPWLLRILHNAYLNRRARAARAPRAIDSQTLEEGQAAAEPTAMPDLTPTLDSEQLDSEVKRAIDGLSEEYRSVLLLWATMELSYRDIAEALDIPIGTVMSRLYRARQQMARVLADYARELGITPEGGDHEQ